MVVVGSASWTAVHKQGLRLRYFNGGGGVSIMDSSAQAGVKVKVL